MKKSITLRRIILVVLAVALLFAVAISADSSTDSYETQNDPLISKSYLTLVFKPELVSYLDGAVAAKVAEQLKIFETDSMQTYVDKRLSDYISISLVPYINGKINDINDTLDGKLNDTLDEKLDAILTERITAKLDELYGELSDKLEELSGQDYAVASKKVTLKKDEIIYSDDICELILRSGKAFVVCSAGDSGASDTTNGVELTDGDSVSLNHNVIISSDNGCGIRAASDVTLYVKGAFSIAKP